MHLLALFYWPASNNHAFIPPSLTLPALKDIYESTLNRLKPLVKIEIGQQNINFKYHPIRSIVKTSSIFQKKLNFLNFLNDSNVF
jgi:hypothetical protein